MVLSASIINKKSTMTLDLRQICLMMKRRSLIKALCLEQMDRMVDIIFNSIDVKGFSSVVLATSYSFLQMILVINLLRIIFFYAIMQSSNNSCRTDSLESS